MVREPLYGNELFLDETVGIGCDGALDVSAISVGQVLGCGSEGDYGVENIRGFSYARFVEKLVKDPPVASRLALLTRDLL
jgi:hypothetical protein